MSQEGKGTPIADDFPAIAARLRELSGQSRQVATHLACAICDTKGWVWSGAALDWRRCPRCGLSQHHPKPAPPR